MQRVGTCSYVIVMQSRKNVYLKVTTPPAQTHNKKRNPHQSAKERKKERKIYFLKGHGTRSLDVSRTVYLSTCHVQFFSEHIMMDFSSVTAPW